MRWIIPLNNRKIHSSQLHFIPGLAPAPPSNLTQIP